MAALSPRMRLAAIALALLPGWRADAVEIRLLAHAEIRSETGAGPTYPAAISADGRYVLLQSVAPNLLAGVDDANGAADLFLRDRTSGSLTLVTHRAGEPWRTADQGSRPKAMTADGEWVLFESWATDLVAGQQSFPFSTDVYLWRRSTGATVLVSHLAGQPLAAAGNSRAVAVTPNGAFVLFDSPAAGITASTDGNGVRDAFLFTRATGAVQLVSATPGGTAGNRISTAIALRDDGSEVLFNSWALDLAGGDYRLTPNVFVRHLATASTRGPLMAEGAAAAAWTPNGRFVLALRDNSEVLLFDRQSGNERLIGSGLNVEAWMLSADGGSALFEESGDVYLHRSAAPQPLCLSCGLGFEGDVAALSAGGEIAAFFAWSDLGPRQAFLYDTATQLFEPVSRRGDGSLLEDGGTAVAMSADGRHFAFAGRQPELDPRYDDSNGNFDAFYFQRGSPGLELLSAAPSAKPVAATLGQSSAATALSASGEEILFTAPAHLTAPQHALPDIAAFSYHLSSGARRLLSPLPGQPSTPARGSSAPLALARDGRVLLVSDSADLAPDRLPTGPQLYLRDPAAGYRLITRKADGSGRASSGVFETVRTDPELREVVFASTGSDLVAGLPEPGFDQHLYLCSLDGAGCQLLTPSFDDPAQPAFGGLYQAKAAADLSAVAFTSASSDLIPGGFGGNQSNVFSWRRGGGVELLSRSGAQPSQQANGSTYSDDISADGRFVLATSVATDLVPGVVDGNGTLDVFVFDSVARTWQLVSSSHLGPGMTASRASNGLEISADGRFVLFSSVAPDLVPGQVDIFAWQYPFPQLQDLFLFDRATGEKKLISHLPGQRAVAAGWSGVGTLAEHGRRVAFWSGSPDLLPGSSGSSPSLYSWDAADGEPRLLHAGAGGPYAGPELFPIANDTRAFDGGALPFNSWNDNVAPGDSNGTLDAFVVLFEALFSDGFESGDSGAWSATLP